MYSTSNNFSTNLLNRCMNNYVAYKFKLKPTKEQAVSLAKMAGSTRFLWNYFLGLNQAKYKAEKKFVFYNEMAADLTKLKNINEYNWLYDTSNAALQQRLRDLEDAIKRCYKSDFGFPKFKCKRNESDTFRIPQFNAHIKPTKKQIKIPKLGWIKWNRHRIMEGEFKSITVKQENGKWMCICLCEVERNVHQVDKLDYTQDCVGIDLGLKEFCVMSDGQVVATPRFYKKQEKKLKRKQRQLSKCKKDSKGREKRRYRLRKLHSKIKNQRSDFTHKLSSQINNDYKFIGVESLNVKGMKKNHKLAKSISDQGWSMFVSQLEYKSQRRGGVMVKVDRFYPSSKTCSNCGNKHDMPLKERTYTCEKCGMILDRDLNAALNIKNEAIRIYRENTCGTQGIYACGDTNTGPDGIPSDRHVSKKQEKRRITRATCMSLKCRSSHPLGYE